MAKEKKEKQAKQLIMQSQEELYDLACAKMKADALIVQFAYKIENYRLAASMFEEVGDYKDAPQLGRKCLELAQKTEQEESGYNYARAVREMDSDDEKNWTKLADTFQKLGDYKDAKERLARCKANVSRESRRRKVRTGLVLGILAAIAALVIWVFVSGANQYILGTAYLYAGMYDKAMTSFEGAGEVLDAPAKAITSRNKQIRSAKRGTDFTFGKYRWKVLARDQQEQTLLAIASSVGTDHDFYLVAFDEAGTADTWEDSSLRAWLNGPVLEEGFTEAERACLILQESPAEANPDYEQRSDTTTEDHLRLLGVSEADEYFDTIKGLGNDCWLRTPGRDPSTFSYITGQHRVRSYGLPSTTQLTVRPVILIDYSGLD